MKTKCIKKSILLILAAALISASCTKSEKKKNHLTVTAAIFPEYDWLLNITAGVENIECILLSKSGVDLHSFQPSAKDIICIKESDLFIYTGGESDSWIKEILQETPEVRSINLLEVLEENVVEEEITEGMETEHHHHADHDEEETEYDEHVWLSLNLASKICMKISRELSELDKDNASSYEKNFSEYNEKLLALENQYSTFFSSPSASGKTLIFCDRFPFRYLAKDYGLNYYAAFSGCSAQTDASFSTMAFLTEKADQLNCSAVFILEESDGKIASTVVSNSKNKNMEILKLDSVQSVSEEKISRGYTYLNAMEQNLEVLKKAFN